MLLWTAFILGLVGSLHCAGMCGPLVLALAKSRPAGTNAWAGRIVYHLGRVAIYTLLGFALGLLGHLIVPTGLQRGLTITLGAILIVGLLAAARIPIAAPVGRLVMFLKARVPSLLRKNSLIAQATLGALNGLLPCGLVYVAAAGATATHHPLTGAAYMALFGLGTWPVMLGIHFAGQRLSLPARLPISGITRAAVFVMALLLILRGLDLGIPYISPHLALTASGEAKCH